MPKDIANLDDILPPELKEAEARKLDPLIDTPLVLYACREVKGREGPYMRVSASLTTDDERFFIATGASQAFEVLTYLKENNLFPVVGIFKKVGRAVILTS